MLPQPKSIKNREIKDTITGPVNHIDTPTEPPFLRTPFNYDRMLASNATGLECKDPTLAQQQFKDECNINILFARYLETGEMPQVLDGLSYGDFEGIFDFQSAMNAVRTAEGLFTQLPARIKNRFDNDPQKLLEFINKAGWDPETREEAEFLQLLKKTDTIPPGNPAPTGGTNETGTQGVSAAASQGPQGHRGTESSAAPTPAGQKP